MEAAADNETYGIQLQQQAAHVFVDSPKEVDEVHLAAEDDPEHTTHHQSAVGDSAHQQHATHHQSGLGDHTEELAPAAGQAGEPVKLEFDAKKQVAALEAAADNQTYGIQLEQQAAHMFVDSPKKVDEAHLAAEYDGVTRNVESSGTMDEQKQDPTILAIGSKLEDWMKPPETWAQRQDRLL